MPRHDVSRVLPYEPAQLFDIAVDVERYPEFIPWCLAARVHRRHDDVYYTDQVIGLGLLRQRFGSKTVFGRPERIHVTSSDRPFRRFELTWLFDPLPEGGCRVSLRVELDFRSPLLGGLFNRAVGRAVDRIMSAFEARARRLYGGLA